MLLIWKHLKQHKFLWFWYKYYALAWIITVYFSVSWKSNNWGHDIPTFNWGMNKKCEHLSYISNSQLTFENWTWICKNGDQPLHFSQCIHKASLHRLLNYQTISCKPWIYLPLLDSWKDCLHGSVCKRHAYYGAHHTRK